MNQADPIVVGTPTISRVGGRSRWSIPVEGPSGMPDQIWYEVPREFTDWLTNRADPALIALTIPSMRLKAPLIVNGLVTDELAFWHRDYQAVYSASGGGPVVDVDLPKVAPTMGGGDGVAMGFSGGIDSFALLGDHYYSSDTPDRLRPTHLLFNNVGSHSEGGRELWRRRFERLRLAADHIGLPFLDIDSNLDEIPAPGIGYEALNSPANASVAHLLSNGIGRWMFASSAEFRRVGVVANAYNTAFVDTIAMPLASTSELTLVTASSRMRRIDKTRVVAKIPDAWTSLDVCVEVRPGATTNCSSCWKCQLTLAALDLIGAEELFSSQFDLDKWYSVRREYLAQIPFTKSPALVRELNELMDEVGYVAERADLKQVARKHRAVQIEQWKKRIRRQGGSALRRLVRRGGASGETTH